MRIFYFFTLCSLFGIFSVSYARIIKNTEEPTKKELTEHVHCLGAFRLHGFCIKELSGAYGNPYQPTTLNADGNPFVFGRYSSSEKKSLMLYSQNTSITPVLLHTKEDSIRKKFIEKLVSCRGDSTSQDVFLEAIPWVFGYDLSNDGDADIYVLGVKNIYTQKHDKLYIAAFDNGAMTPDISSNHKVKCAFE